MSTKLRSFFYSCYTHRRTRYDDSSLRAGECREPDDWTEFRGVVLASADPDWNPENGEPDWDQGGFLVEKRTMRRLPGWNFSGRPPEFLIEAWRERRILDGVIIASDCGKTRR